jgi:response regulator RpfG family c-di-GMP phosphodiesterase
MMITVLMVEQRDEVAARLSADLAGAGFRAVRARSSKKAIAYYVRRPNDVLMVNGDHPDESAWLLAAKLHLTHPTARIWVYMRRLSACDVIYEA